MSDIFYRESQHGKMEVLINSLLLQVKTASLIQNRGTKLGVFVRSRPTTATPSSAECPRCWAITGSGNNVAISPNIVVVPNPKQAYLPIQYTLFRHQLPLLNKTTSGLIS